MPEKGYPKDSPLQIWPRGLLGFLQLKNGGEMPQRLGSEVLVPQVDLIEWYLWSNSEQITGTIAAPGPGFTSPAGFAVPSKEAWYVMAFGGIIFVDAVNTLARATSAIRRNGLLQVPLDHSGGSAQAVGGETNNVCFGITRPILLLPGDQLGVIVNRVGATGVTGPADLAAIICRLPL